MEGNKSAQFVEIEKIQKEAAEFSSSLKTSQNVFVAPMLLSKVLLILRNLRTSLEISQNISMKEQESHAWLVLNSCKLIYDIAQPLIFFDCGKYVVETLTFASLSMESVINLCTTKHIAFRRKLYSSIFYASLFQGNNDEALAIFEHTQRQVLDLKEREELDPPLPAVSLTTLQLAMEDVVIMKFVLDCWKDNDSLDFTIKGIERYSSLLQSMTKSLNQASPEYFNLRCMDEFLKVHHLCCGNANENHMKRTSLLLKAILKLLPSLVEVESASSVFAGAMWEMTSFFINESESLTEENKIYVETISANISKQSAASSEGDLKDKLNVLILAQELYSTPENATELPQKVGVFFGKINHLIFLESSYRSTSMLARLAVSVVKRVLYVPIQKFLSAVESKSISILKSLTYGLMAAMKCLESVFCQDGIFYGTVAALTGNALLHIRDHRGAISMLRQAINVIEEQRAARIDFCAMQPEDVRDIVALQRQSFTTRSSMDDWYNSVKRLGAHAFAGFGIFGLGSSADRGDQALAEIHTDLLALHYRAELTYGMMHYAQRKKLLTTFHQAQLARAAALKENPNKKKPKEKNAGKTALTTHKEGAAGNEPDALNTSIDLSSEGFVSIEKLPVFNTLKVMCVKNSHALALLHCEAARLESNADIKHDLLVSAFNAIEAAELQEDKLLTSFQDLTLFANTDRKHPILLGRTHRYLYVAPVGCRKLKNAAYYKVLAKEKGSGTEVSIYNTDLAGCQVKLNPEAMSNFKDCVVRIGPLRNGEMYMLGCAAYNSHDQIVGGVSPSTLPVEAINPLPTVVLWSILGQTAELLGVTKVAIEASSRVCERYFLKMPLREAMSLTSGRNLFLYHEPVICSLALQQSTSVMIHHFLDSLIRYEALNFKEMRFGQQKNWNYRQQVQIRYLLAFERCAAVAPIAAGHGQQDLLFRLISLGDQLLAELMRYDFVHLATKLQHGITALILAAQRVPKSNWHNAEHRLYYKLLSALIQVGIIGRNLSPLISVLLDTFPESRDKEVSALVLPSRDVVPNIEALLKLADASLGDSIKSSLIDGLKRLTANEIYIDKKHGDISDFWKLSSAQRFYRLQKKAKDLSQPPPADSKAPVAPEKVELEKYLVQDLPIKYSDFLEIILQLLRELKAGDAFESFHGIIQRFPICLDFLASEVKQQLSTFDLTMGLSLDKFFEYRTASAAPVAAAGKKAAPPPKKGAAPEPEPVVVNTNVVPDRFLHADESEKRKQFALLAEICFIMVSVHERNNGAINFFAKAYHGPTKRVLPDQIDLKSDYDPTIAISASNNVTHDDILRLFSSSITLFVKAGWIESATNIYQRLWNFIIAEYIDANQFVVKFANQKVIISVLLSSLVELIDKMVEDATGPECNGENELITDMTSAYLRKDIYNGLSALLEPMVFIVKAYWLFREFPQEVVSLSSRIFLHLYSHSRECLNRFCNECWPLVIDAQQALVNVSKDVLAAGEKTLQDFIADYEEAQRKKRKKKLRIARTEKDEEELIFEAEKGRLEEIVQQAQVKLCERDAEMDEVLAKEESFKGVMSKAVLITAAVKEKLFRFLSTVNEKYTMGADWRIILQSDQEIAASFVELRTAFERAARYLREVKERVLLVEVLEDLTNLLIRFGLYNEAQQFLLDIADGLFNTMDACMHWQEVTSSALLSFDYTLVPGLPYVITALGKLSRFCSTNDYDAKLRYARMSTEISRIFYQESIGHPTTKKGFACYECMELGGLNAIPAALFRGLFAALEEQLYIMHYHNLDFHALPLIVFGEHIAAVYMHSPRLWLQMRLFRIRILIKHRFFAEAISMMSNIKFMIHKIHQHEYGDILRMINANDSKDVKAFDRSGNDLNFEGAPSFFNNLLPSDEKSTNGKAIDWVNDFPVELDAFLQSFTILIPESEMSPEDRQRAEERRAKAVAEAEAAAASKKGGKKPAAGKDAATENADHSPSVKLFPSSMVASVYILCATLLAEISAQDPSQASKFAEFGNKLHLQATTLLSKGKELLLGGSYDVQDIHDNFLWFIGSDAASQAKENNFRYLLSHDRDWLDCYAMIFGTEYSMLLQKRRYREVLAGVVRLQKLLSHPSLQQVSGDHKVQLSQLWFTSRWIQLKGLHGQGNKKEVIAMSSRCIHEANAIRFGHWQRAYFMLQAQAMCALGEYVPALAVTNACESSYANAGLEDVQLVHCLALKTTIRRHQVQFHGYKDIAEAFEQALKWLRSAAEIAQRLALTAGTFPPDYNLTFNKIETATIGYHLLPPLLHTFTDIHGNASPLTINSVEAAKKGGTLTGSSTAGQNLRLGPVDENDTTFAPMEGVNIYLQESRTLLMIQVALLQTIDDLRGLGLSRLSAKIDTGFGTNKANAALQSLLEDEPTSFDPAVLQLEQIHLGEYVLKVSQLFLKREYRILFFI